MSHRRSEAPSGRHSSPTTAPGRNQWTSRRRERATAHRERWMPHGAVAHSAAAGGRPSEPHARAHRRSSGLVPSIVMPGSLPTRRPVHARDILFRRVVSGCPRASGRGHPQGALRWTETLGWRGSGVALLVEDPEQLRRRRPAADRHQLVLRRADDPAHPALRARRAEPSEVDHAVARPGLVDARPEPRRPASPLGPVSGPFRYTTS